MGVRQFAPATGEDAWQYPYSLDEAVPIVESCSLNDISKRIFYPSKVQQATYQKGGGSNGG
jgi:hypothetical protein